jgi:hypothetical protein
MQLKDAFCAHNKVRLSIFQPHSCLFTKAEETMKESQRKKVAYDLRERYGIVSQGSQAKLRARNFSVTISDLTPESLRYFDILD